MSSGSGSGADQHLLALLRAIRLRQAAPDAVAAGVADTAAALTDPQTLRPRHPALPAGEDREALPPVAGSPGAESPAAGSTVAGSPVAGSPVGLPRPEWATPHPATTDEPALTGEQAAPTGDFDRDATADFFGRSKSPAPTPVAARKSAARPSPFDHGPQLRPAGLPSLGPHPHPDPDPRHQLGLDPRSHPVLDPRGQPVLDPRGQPVLDPRRRRDLEPLRERGVEPYRQAGDDVEAAAPGAGPVRATGSRAAATPQETPGQLPPAPLRGLAADHPHPAPHPHAAPTGRTGAPTDGMDPSDDALLRLTQRQLSTSLTFAGGPAEVAERFRTALHEAQPALISALPGSPRTQIDQLARGLTWLVHHLDQPPELVTGCGSLGAALAECGVRPQQLRMVGAALAEAMRAGMAPGAWREDFDVAWRSTWQHAYEWIVHGEMLIDYQPTVWTAEVVEHELRRHDLAVIRLRPFLPMPFRPGQYARVEVPEVPGVWRPYSLAGQPRRNDLIELHVRAKTQSGVSGTLVYRTEVGDQVRLTRAEGAMGLPAEAGRDLLMIAGDTGVAPLKALLTELADTGDPRSAVLFWGVRNLDELYDIDEIAEIARAARRATVVPVISEGDPGPYASGLVTDAVAAYGEWSGHEVYLAGPPLMLAATSAALHLLGVAPDHIHHDVPE